MKFKLGAAGYYYSKEDKESLEKLGFNFIKNTNADFRIASTVYHRDSRQKDLHIEINTLEELMKFIDSYGEIILSDGTLIIYDDYWE